jgi:hypothetical protein
MTTVEPRIQPTHLTNKQSRDPAKPQQLRLENVVLPIITRDQSTAVADDQ